MHRVRTYEAVVRILLACCVASFEYAADREAAELARVLCIPDPGSFFVVKR